MSVSCLAISIIMVPAPNASAARGAPVAPTYLSTMGGATTGHASMYPAGFDVDANGNLYVADLGNDQVAAFDATGHQLWRTGTRSVGAPGFGQFLHPSAVAYAGGQVFVADGGDNRVEVLNAANGAPMSVWSATFSALNGIAAGVDASANPIILATDSGANQVRIFTPAGVPAPVPSVGAGGGSGPGQLASPRDAATDQSGNIYVADAGNNRVDRFTPVGAVVSPSWAGASRAAQLIRPVGVRVDSSGNVYVADGLNNQIAEFSTAGTVTKTFGSAGAGAGQFSGIRGLAVGAGATPTVYGADLPNYRIEQFSNAGTFAKTIGGVRPVLGQFNQPMGVDVSSSSVYVADSSNQRIDAFATPSSGSTPQASWPSGGFGSGAGGLAWPRAVAFSSTSSTVWVADTYNQRAEEYSTTGKATGRTLGGAGTALGKMLLPSGIVIYQANVAVADTLNNRVQMLNPSTNTLVWSYAGLKQPRGLAISGSTIYVADTAEHQIVELNATNGSRIVAFGASTLVNPLGVAPMSDGTTWVSDATLNELIQFSKIGTVLQTFGSTGTSNSQFNAPAGLGVIPGGSPTLLVADSLNNRVQVFAITTGVAPSTPVWDHDLGTTATSNLTPTGVVRDSNGNWYVDDAGEFVIKEFDPTGSTLLATIFTVGVKGDDPTHIAQSRGLGIDPNTNELWVCDTVNNRILKMSTDFQTMEVNTVVADNTQGPPLSGPVGIAVDPATGNAYIADTDNRVIEISPTGQFIRQWGSLTVGNGPGKFNTPAAITYSGVGGPALYVNDAGNFRVQKFTLTGQFLASFGSEGLANGQFTKDARGVAVDNSGIIYASDIGGNRILRWAPTGAALPSLGAGLPYYQNSNTSFFYGARGLWISNGTLAISDLFNYRILFWDLNGNYVNQIQGSLPPPAGHNLPHGIALDAAGNIYVSDYWNQWIQKFSPTGTLLARWGLGRGSDPGTLNFPGGIRVAPNGKYLYISNRESNVIDRWNLSNGQFNARYQLPGGKQPKAWPRDVAIDPTSSFFAVPDEKNNQVDVVSATLGSNGTDNILQIITNYGPGAGQPMGSAQSVAYDSQSNLYVADGTPVLGQYYVHVYSTFEGVATWIQDIAVADEPGGITVAGNFLYVLSSADSNVGVYTTSGGPPILRWGSLGNTANNQFNNPYVGIAVDPAGNVYIADTFNHRVKVFRPGP